MEKNALPAGLEALREELKNKRFLITGAGGLIGSTLVELLAEADRAWDLGLEISVLGRRASALRERFAEQIGQGVKLPVLEGDVCTADLSGGRFDMIVHAASPAHPLAYSQTPVDVMKANILGAMNMLELARSAGARFLFLSSGEIYGISGDADSAFREGDYGYIEISDPRSCYPESKRAAETLCASYRSQYGVDAVAARLCHVYGPAITGTNSRADAQFLRCAAGGEDIVMKSPGSQVRSFCYVKDVAAGLLYILLRGESGQAYNIANRHSIATIRQYAQTLAELGGVKIRDEFPSETEARGYSRVSRAVLDAAKLEGLGWQPAYDLRAGLAETLRLASGGARA